MVYVCRNAKDTCVSYYHHCRLLEGYTGDFQEFCQLFLSGAGTGTSVTAGALLQCTSCTV